MRFGRSSRNTKISFAAAGLVLVVAVAAVTVGSASGKSRSASAGPVKIAFLYIGAAKDGGWDAAFDKGRQAIQKTFGSKVKTTYKENVAESPQATQVIDSLVQDGYKFIIATSFGYGQYMAQAAAKYPDVKFLQWSGAKTLKNLGTFIVNFGEPWYPAGMALAAASKTGKLGMVAPFPVPNILQQTDALLLGARAVNPKATVRVVFVSSWFDPAKETQATQALISSGVDAIAFTTPSPSPGQAANKAGAPWVAGQVENGVSYGPKTFLTVATPVWSKFLVQQTGAVLAGKWKPQAFFGTWQKGTLANSPTTPAYQKRVSAEVRKKIDAVRNRLSKGTFALWKGPIKDQSGKVRIPAGKVLTPAQIVAIDWLVEGTIGKAK
jgi:basic membrane protein A